MPTVYIAICVTVCSAMNYLQLFLQQLLAHYIIAKQTKNKTTLDYPTIAKWATATKPEAHSVRVSF